MNEIPNSAGVLGPELLGKQAAIRDPRQHEWWHDGPGESETFLDHYNKLLEQEGVQLADPMRLEPPEVQDTLPPESPDNWPG